ncbi:hypothetical protein GCM10009555_017970 [Acrocarpospora macrocephala]|uniref:Uncharacterized protein n=1 Tax=Acrocarpospora macrocephala TaxID=150177 RepID=A0A5M3WEG3_9ACTN|nr:hypothetical protein [Acrocarpospora macrocephala]GES07457.1 hypothetical protein Amac_010520 [Acrocarpospora macrocephala]
MGDTALNARRGRAGAGQLALFKPKPPRPKKPAPLWCAWLQECALHSSQPALYAWWIPCRWMLDDRGKIRILACAPPGDELEIGPYEDRGEPEFFVDHLIAKGVVKSIIKVRRWDPSLVGIGGGR